MKMISQGLRPPLPKDIKPCIKQMIEQCWQGNPDNRPSSDELYDLVTHIIRPQLKDESATVMNITQTLKNVTKTQEQMRQMSFNKNSGVDVSAQQTAKATLDDKGREARTVLSVVKDDEIGEMTSSGHSLINTQDELKRGNELEIEGDELDITVVDRDSEGNKASASASASASDSAPAAELVQEP